MSTVIIVIVAFVLVALAGWGIAELKYKSINYKAGKGDAEAQEKALQQAREKDFGEMDIKDVRETISAKGFDAV